MHYCQIYHDNGDVNIVPVSSAFTSRWQQLSSSHSLICSLSHYHISLASVPVTLLT